MLRLVHADNMAIRFRTVFGLLIVGRIDDAYNFLKWWVMVSMDDEYDWSKVPKSSVGEWTYLIGQDKTEDIFELIPGDDIAYMDTSFLLALVAMKIVIINDLEAKGKASGKKKATKNKVCRKGTTE
jgi:hypothetical protein